MVKVIVSSKKEAEKVKGNTDWGKVKALAEEEIHDAALSDPDAQPLTEEELEKFTPVIHKGGGVYGHDKNKSNKQSRGKKD